MGDQLHLVVAVQDQDLDPLVDLDPPGPAARVEPAEGASLRALTDPEALAASIRPTVAATAAAATVTTPVTTHRRAKNPI